MPTLDSHPVLIINGSSAVLDRTLQFINGCTTAFEQTEGDILDLSSLCAIVGQTISMGALISPDP
jgi:hypothetical protein